MTLFSGKKYLVLKVSESLWYAFVISAKNDFDLGMAHGHLVTLFLFFDQEGPKQHLLEVLADLFQNNCWYCLATQLLILIEFYAIGTSLTENQVKNKVGVVPGAKLGSILWAKLKN